jgi:hypothetical protein
MAASMSARFVTDFDPGIVMTQFMALEGSALLIKGAGQFVIALILPVIQCGVRLSKLSAYVWTLCDI